MKRAFQRGYILSPDEVKILEGLLAETDWTLFSTRERLKFIRGAVKKIVSGYKASHGDTLSDYKSIRINSAVRAWLSQRMKRRTKAGAYGSKTVNFRCVVYWKNKQEIQRRAKE